MGAAYTFDIPASKRIGGQLNYAKNAGVITDALVNANSTITTLKAALTTGGNPTLAKAVSDTKLALDKAVDMGLLSATHGKTTVAGLVAATDASTTHLQNFFN